MGSCNYYFKADFGTEEAAAKVVPELKQFLRQAATFSMDNVIYSGISPQGNPPNIAKKKMEIIRNKYPLMAEYIDFIGGFSKLDHNQDFGQDDDEIESLNNTNSVIAYVGIEVGHTTSWSDLCEFIKHKWHAVKAVWGSEEEGCNLDSLNLWEWEEIVQALLKQPILHTLMGTHNDLDVLIEREFKKETTSNGKNKRNPVRKRK